MMIWVLKPFKVFICWYDHLEFVPLVKTLWDPSNVQGKKFVRLIEKLRRLKDKLKGWNHEVFGIFDQNVKEAIKDLNSLDHQVVIEGKCVLKDVSVKRVEAIARVWQIIHHKESMLRQKSRVGWVRWGDSN